MYFSFVLLRKVNHEACTLRIGGVKGDISTQTAGNATGDGKSDARAVNILVKLYELLKDVFGLLLGNADAGILDNELYVMLIGSTGNTNGDITLWRELNGIV